MDSAPTIIGPGQRFLGDIAGDGDVTVQGRLDGMIHIGGTLTVGPDALVMADVVATSVRIEGRLEGRVRSAGDVTISSRGCLVGDVEGMLHVEEGGIFQGHITTEEPNESTSDRMEAAPPVVDIDAVDEEPPPVQAVADSSDPTPEHLNSSGSIRRLTHEDTIPPAPPETKETSGWVETDSLPENGVPPTRKQATRPPAGEHDPERPAESPTPQARPGRAEKPITRKTHAVRGPGAHDDLEHQWFQDQDYLADSK